MGRVLVQRRIADIDDEDERHGPVHVLGAGQGESAAEQLASALRSLAAAVELLPGATWARAQKIRDAARELESESTSDKSRMQSVVDGLGALARALVDVDRPARPVEFQAEVTSLGKEIDALDRAAPLAGQQRRVVGALRTAADATFLAAGRERQFTATTSAAPKAGSRDAFSSHVAAATKAVEKLARTSSPLGRQSASEALSALADAIEAAPARPDEVAGRVAEIRFQAERLRRADPLSFGDTRWIQMALTAALDSLEVLPSGRAPRVRPWVAAARRATEAIAPGRSLSFQRAAVQDAFRATVDGFTAAAEMCRCRTRAPR